MRRVMLARSEEEVKWVNGALKSRRKALDKAEKELMKEMYKQIDIVSGSIGIALYENWGWRDKRIAKYFREINEVWKECSADKDVSMLEMCENETGLVITLPGFEGDYKELKYFRERRPEDEDMTYFEMIAMRQQQKRWIGVMILASAFLAIHRLYGFGGERIVRLKEQMEEVRDRYGWDARKIEKACFDMTGVAIEVR